MSEPYKPPNSAVVDSVRFAPVAARSVVAFLAGVLLVPALAFGAMYAWLPAAAVRFGNVHFWIPVVLGSFGAAAAVLGFRRISLGWAAVLGPLAALIALLSWCAVLLCLDVF